MFKSKKLLLLLPIIGVLLVSYTYIVQNQKDEAIDHIIVQSLNASHYSPEAIDDKFSEKVFKLYLERLDYNKKFLLQSDVNELKKMEHNIDEDINNGRFEFFDKSFELINKRIAEAQVYYTDLLAQPITFDKNEELELDVEKISFAKNKDELKEAWRKHLKYQVLSKIVDAMESQEKAKEKSDTVKIKTKDELEIEARKKVLKSNDDWFKRLKKLDRDDRIATYFNAVTGVYDPHTEFYPPKEKANFDIGMSGQLEGIGAQLQEKDGAIKVSSIVPGSASYRQGQLKAGDIIVKVAQGEAEPVD
ncbi:MAG: PDZ domain-containing protein, partial [Bacteroidia bacterium]